MKKMGSYCKAYPIKQLRQFPQWSEQPQNPRTDPSSNDKQVMGEQRTFTEEDFLYLQENYVVTDDIFLEENIIFEAVSPEWIAFCTETLKFKVPVEVPVEVPTQQTQES